MSKIEFPAFHDPSLYRRALTHRSFSNEHPNQALEDNERLEFLGDAVLDFATAAFLYHRFPEADEGRLTSLRAALVRTETLARIAGELGLGEKLLLGKGEEESGGRRRTANLCASFEAVVGALYLDQGMERVQKVMEPLFSSLVEEVLIAESYHDAKSLLQELSQASFGLTPVYRTVQAEGPDHARVFTVEVSIGDRSYGQGRGRSKQMAAQTAAVAALERIRAEKESGGER